MSDDMSLEDAKAFDREHEGVLNDGVLSKIRLTLELGADAVLPLIKELGPAAAPLLGKLFESILASRMKQE